MMSDYNLAVEINGTGGTSGGRTGDSVVIKENVISVPGTGSKFDMRVISGSDSPTLTLKVVSAGVEKTNKDPVETEIEVTVAGAFREFGYDVPKITGVSGRRINMNHISGLSYYEEIFYNPSLTVQELQQKMQETFNFATKMNNDLSLILKERLSGEQKTYLLKKVPERLLEEAQKELGIETPSAEIKGINITSKIRARAEELKEQNLVFDELIYRTLDLLESLAEPYLKKSARWSLDLYGPNFISNSRIDFNNIRFGAEDDSALLDTPYMLSDTFWIQRLHEPNLSQMREIERKKARLIKDRADNQESDSNCDFIAFQASRVFRNILQMMHSYNDARAKVDEAVSGDNIAQFELFTSLNQVFAHYECADIGLTSVLGNCSEKQNQDYLAVKQNAEQYKTAMDEVVKQMCANLIPDNEKLKSYLFSFSLVRSDYENFKQVYPVIKAASNVPGSGVTKL